LVQVTENEVLAAEDAVASEEALRANTYALLAALLRAPPSAEILRDLTRLDSDDTELGHAIAALGAAAGSRTVEDVADEFHNLFIGVGASELKPYASYYLTGFLYEKPLADLRDAMTALGIERAGTSSEPEDHVAALCEIMCGLITGAFGARATLADQHAFFDRHIAPWADRLFEDLQTAESSDFYKPVGVIGGLFMRIETQSFEMAA
jgi:TorA maturation chaperone TorD